MLLIIEDHWTTVKCVGVCVRVFVSFCTCARLVKEHLGQEHEQLRQECLHLKARLAAAQNECQKEREVRTGRQHDAWLDKIYVGDMINTK